MTGHGHVRSSPYEIIVVDDNPAARKLLSKLLERNGYRVRTADSGLSAIKSVASRLPDLILLDVMMMEMDGVEVCRRLKSEKTSREIPIIFISALDDTAQKVEGFLAGGVDYITKPFQPEEVLARVGTHLRLRELNERLEQKVAERTAELTKANQSLRREINHRRQTERDLQLARADLERMVEERNDELSEKNRQLIDEIEEHRKTEKALRESEVKYRTIFETTASATMIVKNDSTISLVNTEFEHLTGYPKSQVEGIKKWTEFIAEEDIERMQQYHRLRRVDPQAAPRNYECRTKNKNGQYRNIFVTVAMLPGTDKSVASMLDVSKLKQTEQDLRKSENRLHHLSSRLLTAQENERQRISMEIHDELGQNLALLKLQLNSLAGKLRKDQGKLKTEFNHVMNFIDNIIEEMRRISRDLSPSVMQDLKLGRSLQWMLHDFNKHTGIRTYQDIMDIDALFDDKEQVNIYRIFQEALNNIRKHAQAQNVKAVVHKNDEKIRIEIEDDGKGFDLDDVWNRQVTQRGLGIASLQERTRMLGGTFDLKSETGKGTHLHLIIPIGRKRGGQ